MVPLHFIPGSASAVSAAVSLWAKPGPRQRFSLGFLPAAGRLVLESASLKRQCSRWSSGGGQALDRARKQLDGFYTIFAEALAARHRVEKNRATVPLVVDARGPWDRAARVRARRRKAVGQTKTQGRAMLRAGTILHASDGDGEGEEWGRCSGMFRA